MSQPTPQEQFEAALAPHLTAIYGAARHLTRNPDDAEDLVQDAATLAFRAFSSFQPGTNFKAWFLRIMTNQYYALGRKRKREPLRTDLEEASDLYLYLKAEQAGLHAQSADPAGAILEQLDAEAISAALAALPEEHRIVATLYFAEEFSYQEIADIAGVPVGTVRSRLHRARKLLQKALWQLAEERGITPKATPTER